jgi:threonine/homoserine/homoserine lactone efflux protein
MPELDLLLPFAAATLIFAFMPGPALLYTAAQTLVGGRRGGFLAALGIHVGGFVHVVAAAAGLSAIFSNLPAAYLALKIAGALYLIWLGIGIMRGRLDPEALPHVHKKSPQRAFLESVTVEVLNPKAALFYIAFLPQFIDPAAVLPVWMQFLVLGTIVNIAFSSVDVITVLMTASVMKRLKRSANAQRVVRILGGSVLVGLGAHLAISRN